MSETPTPVSPGPVPKQTFRQVVWRSFCESDERYLDLTRVLSFAGVVTFLALSIHAALVGAAWDPVSFGTGLGGLLFGGAVGTGLRAKLEDGTLNPSGAPSATRTTVQVETAGPLPDGPPIEHPNP